MAQRRESVLLELSDSFSTEMIRAAAAAGLLSKELNSLSGQSVRLTSSTRNINREVDSVARSANRADRSINQLTGRLRLFADAAAVFGPAAVPLGGVLTAGVAGFASQLGFAAVAGGVLVGSMQGLGDALKALNDAELEPTAENLAAAEDALRSLSPAAADFAREAYGMVPVLKQIRDAGAESLFPGLTESLDDLERLAPVVTRIFESVGSALGQIASGGAASLATDRWTGFFEFIATEAPRALSELASTVGSLTHGLGELWIAFTPLNNDFSGWLMDVAAGFDDWASGLAQTEGFQDFVEYIRVTGPQVAETLGALGGAIVQIVEAAAPLGGPTLAAIEAVADAFSLIAGSDVGTALLTAASALALFNRSGMLVEATQKRIATSTLTMNQALGRGAAGLAGLAIASTDAGASLGVTNTTSLALMGTMAGPWGAAFGAGVGALLDMNAASEQAKAQFEAFKTSLESMSLADLISELERAQGLLSAVGEDSLAAEVISTRVGALEDEVEVRQKLAAEQERLAGQTAYRDELEAETTALRENIAAMQAKRDEALRSFSAETNYAQALLDAKDALKDNGRAWNLNTDAGLKNRRVVEQQASAWNELNRTQGQTPEQARKARRALEDTAISLGASKEEARRYARQLLDIPNDLKTKIALDVDTAVQRAKAIKAELASIDRNIDVYVNVRRPNAGGFGPQVGSSADGGSVPKTGLPYADRHLYMLADGEEIISNRYGQADRFRADRSAGRIPGYADGGTSGKKPVRGAAFYSPDNSDSLQAAIDRLTMVAAEQTTALQAATSAQDYWAGKMADLAQATVSGFNTSLFDRSSDPWSAGRDESPLGNVNADIAGLAERARIQAQLAGMGITGEALATILREGDNAEIASLIASGQAQATAAAIDQRAALQGSVGAQAGQAAYGMEYAAAAAESAALRAEAQKTNIEMVRLNTQMARTAAAVERMEQNAPERTGAEVGRAINGGASGAHRAKKNGGK